MTFFSAELAPWSRLFRLYLSIMDSSRSDVSSTAAGVNFSIKVSFTRICFPETDDRSSLLKLHVLLPSFEPGPYPSSDAWRSTSLLFLVRNAWPYRQALQRGLG